MEDCFQVTLTNAQIPQRLTIPAAVLIPQSKPSIYRQQRIQALVDSIGPPQQRTRPNTLSAPTERPVFEEVEESVDSSKHGSVLDEEVARLGQFALHNVARQQPIDVEPEPPKPFRPERPLPIMRQGIRDRDEVPVRLQPPPQPIRQPAAQVIKTDEMLRYLLIIPIVFVTT